MHGISNVYRETEKEGETESERRERDTDSAILRHKSLRPCIKKVPERERERERRRGILIGNDEQKSKYHPRRAGMFIGNWFVQSLTRTHTRTRILFGLVGWHCSILMIVLYRQFHRLTRFLSIHAP